jgi:prepilin-type N-terminal cleavage/methylation domain-containing protein
MRHTGKGNPVRARSGFTIVELLTVLVILGLLALIAVNRFWVVKERAYKVSMRNDLRNAVTQQERYFGSNQLYAPDDSLLSDFQASPGVTITVTWSGQAGWAGIAQHASIATDRCGYYIGPAPAGIAAPATSAGVVMCD